MIRRAAEEPSTTVQAVMDGESILNKHTTFGRFFGFPERKGAREVGNPS